MKKHIRDERRPSNYFSRPYTTAELVQVYKELEYHEEHGGFSPTATLRVKMRARRIRNERIHSLLTYEEKKKRLRDMILYRVKTEKDD